MFCAIDESNKGMQTRLFVRIELAALSQAIRAQVLISGFGQNLMSKFGKTDNLNAVLSSVDNCMFPCLPAAPTTILGPSQRAAKVLIAFVALHSLFLQVCMSFFSRYASPPHMPCVPSLTYHL